MRTYLKQKKLNCFIKITNNIFTNLKILSPPSTNDNIFQSLLIKFQNVEGAFNSDNNVRKNLLPNSYLLFRFFQELNLEYYLPFISLTKNTKLLARYGIEYKKLILNKYLCKYCIKHSHKYADSQ